MKILSINSNNFDKKIAAFLGIMNLLVIGAVIFIVFQLQYAQHYIHNLSREVSETLTVLEPSIKNLEIISIDVWIIQGETANLVKQFLSDAEEQDVSFDWVFGVDDVSGTLYFKYADSGVPMLYLLDENGNIYYTKAGYTEYSVLAEKIDELM